MGEKSIWKTVTFITVAAFLLVLFLFFRYVLLRKKLNNINEANRLSVNEIVKENIRENPDLIVKWNKEPGLWDRKQYPKIELISDLEIGGEDDTVNIFHRVIHVESDKYGNIYVSQFFSGRIRKYNEQGKYIKSFGRHGGAPGEFLDGIVKYKINSSGDRIYVFDRGSQRISCFNAKGDFLSYVNLSKRIVNLYFGFTMDKEGNFYISALDNETDTVIHKYDKNGKYIQSFGKPILYKGPLNYNDFSVKRDCSKGELFVFGDYLFYTQINPYEIRRYTKEGKLSMLIMRKNKFMPPYKLEIAGKNRYVSKMFSESTLIRVWNNMIINSVWVPDNISQKTGCVVDFYSMDGNLLTSVYIKEKLFFETMDRKGRLYGFTISYDKPQKVVRYRIKIIKDPARQCNP